MNIIGISTLFIVFIANAISPVMTGLSILLLLIELIVFSLTALSDPGIVFVSDIGPLDNKDEGVANEAGGGSLHQQSLSVHSSEDLDSKIIPTGDETVLVATHISTGNMLLPHHYYNIHYPLSQH
jgi:hypothetical protein